MLSANVILVSAAESGESPISPYAVGGIALGILLLSLLILLSFAGGREHS